jgi:hypothetical protein
LFDVNEYDRLSSAYFHEREKATARIRSNRAGHAHNGALKRGYVVVVIHVKHGGGNKSTTKANTMRSGRKGGEG